MAAQREISFSAAFKFSGVFPFTLLRGINLA